MSEANNNKYVGVGVDLGTTFSCVGTFTNGRVEVLKNTDGEPTTPSVVYYDPQAGSTTVGANAYYAGSEFPGNLVYEAKRMINQSYDSKIIQESIENWAFKLKKKEGTSDNIVVTVNIKGEEVELKPIQISAEVLRYVTEPCKDKLGKYPNKYVVTHPAYFDDEAKRRTKYAAEIGCCKEKDAKVEINLLPEPTAAATYYAFDLMEKKQYKEDDEVSYLVVDIGGGTFDCSYMNFTVSAGTPIGEVQAIDGDHKLGGIDYDNILMKYAKDKFALAHPTAKFDLTTEEGINASKAADLRLRKACTSTKLTLSQSQSATIAVNWYCGQKDLRIPIQRAEFERLSAPLFDKVDAKVKGTLLKVKDIKVFYNDKGLLNIPEILRENKINEAKINSIIAEVTKEIDAVIMVGGSCKIPRFRSLLEERFGDKVKMPIDPDLSIAFGATLAANAGNPDVASSSNVPVVADITPLAFCIDTVGGVATKLIDANSTIPIRKSQTFSTAADSQTSVEIVISQGCYSLTKNNKLIGRFTLDGIPPAPRGTPQIDVTFYVDANGILEVTACEKGSNITNKITISNANDISAEELDDIKANFEKFRVADEEAKKVIDAKNAFDADVGSAERGVESLNLTAEGVENFKNFCKENQQWLLTCGDSVELGAVENKHNEFKEKLKEFYTQYKAPEGQGASNNDNPDVEEVN